MSGSVNWILILVSLLFLILGGCIKHGKCYWLISGYNTASSEKKKNYDIEGLGRFMGNFSFLMALVMLLAALFAYLDRNIPLTITLGTLFLIIPVMLLKAQKFDRNTQTPDGKTKKSVLVLIWALILVIVLLPAAIIYSGSKEVVVQFGAERLSIGSSYGKDIPYADIQAVSMLQELPRLERKTNGFDFMEFRKGHFQGEVFGSALLFIQSKNPPFVLIEEKERVLINWTDPVKTEEFYQALQERLAP